MGKFNNTGTATAAGRGPIRTGTAPETVTFEGGPGFLRDGKSELFLLAVANMVGEDTFYETAGGRDSRYVNLVRAVAVGDPVWMAGFLRWLRGEGNMRSASLVGALEAARAMVAAGVPGARPIVASVLQRADEPGEALAYWTSRYGRALPKPVKRGVADAVGRLYKEFSLLKYDTVSKGFRFADVIELVHPSPSAPWQGDLFQVALERRHNRDEGAPMSLPMLVANGQMRQAVVEDPTVLLDPARLKTAGMTWEDALSLAGSKVDKAKLWESIAPNMGLMALARNLRNMDEAGVSDKVAATVAARFADPVQVGRSRMFPYRWLAAYEQAPSLRWGQALDAALQASLVNVPALPGRTLVLVDTSASMRQSLSTRSKMSPVKAAAVFGVALAAKGEQVDLCGFASGVFRHQVGAGASVIREVDRLVGRVGEVGHGTDIPKAVRSTFKGHDRVFVVSDMQTIGGPYGRGVGDLVPAAVPLYGVNLGGYAPAAFGAGTANRVEFGGLSDATFRQVPLLERGRDSGWPWE